MIGFVYIWYDINRKMFYIGSHVGNTTDGYVCSNKRMLLAYKKRPNTFKRRILAVITGGSKKDVHLAEQRWLEMIKDVELSTGNNKIAGTIRYYNVKKTAFGGNGNVGSNGALRGKMKYYNPETYQQGFFHDGCEPSGWVAGVPANKTSASETIWIHHPELKKNKRVKNITPELISDGWIVGRLQTETLKSGMRLGGQRAILKIDKTAPRPGKPIITPFGVFEKIKDAARALDVPKGTIWARLRNRNMPDWRYKE